MCGITGIIHKQIKASEELLQSMSSKLQHRGPDGEGTHVYNNVGIAHRRLSFIDLQGGVQPLSNEDETIWITFNGELYNFQELTKELKAKGHVFKTKSDTETIVHAYEEWGVDCVKRFRGMFAFAIVDQNKEQVFMARDHIGIKPLFYTVQKEFTAFASELQAFQPIKEFDFSLDLKALDQYLWFQYIPAPHSIFDKVKKLEPGHSITFNFEGELTSHQKYWHFKFDPNQKRSEGEWVEQLDVALRDSVKKHLISEVPFGAFLSGGLDSTVVVNYMQELLDYPVKTFSIGFNEEKFSELPYAQQVADKLGTEHHVEIVKPDALKILPEIVKHYGEPFGDSSAVPTYYVSKMASQHVKMVLSGDGGDEALAGYKTYSSFMTYEYVEGSKWKSKAYDVASKMFPSKYPSVHSLDKWYNYIQYMRYDWRKELWKDEYHRHLHQASDEFNAFYKQANSYSPIHKLQYLDLKTYLPYDILTKVDAASMIHSLEVRTPLVDKEIWDLSAQIPSNFTLKKVDDDWSGKILLKRILERKFSKDFVHRKKMGLLMPVADWFGVGGSSRKELEEILYSPTSQISEYFNHSGIQMVLNSNNYGAMWLLLFLEYWLKDFHETK